MEGPRRPPPYPVQPGSQPPPQMQGFGSADITSPFNYGSVEDGRYRQDSLEQKLRKQYWKTKQTVIEKLGKNQDEFVVAGDADIDVKLEKAFHLQSSCEELLSALDKYISRLRAESVHERIMGEHLKTWSETEYTNAGEVMQNVGKIQEGDAKKRLNMEIPLQRMQSEFMVFRVTAIRDLSLSIQRLQKARTEYRAALLWMKDVSEKLQNPDYRNQLFKFREAQVAVKESKRRYEKLKFDLGEKIDMVSASRCNLLSRSLPNYQKEVLSFYDEAANEFHKILVDLRSHHHHQYKVRRLADEIRDLELEDSPFSDESGLLNQSKSSSSDDVPLLDLGNGLGGADGAEGGATGDQRVQAPPKRMLGSDQLSIEKIEEEAKVKDLALSGIEAELRELQKEVLQPSSNDGQQQQVDGSAAGEGGASSDKEEMNEFRDLLQLEEEHDLDPSKLQQPSQDKLFDDWSSFSAFMNTSAQEDKTKKESTSGWEKELMSTSSEENSLMGLDLPEGGILSPTQAKGETPPTVPASSTDQTSNNQVDQPTQPKPEGDGKNVTNDEKSREENKKDDGKKKEKNTEDSSTGAATGSGESSDLLSEDLKALDIPPEMAVPSAPKPAPLGGDVGTLDPSYFNAQQQLPQPIMGPMVGAPQSAALPSSMMMVVAPPPYPGSTPSGGQQPPMFRSPQSNSHGPILAPYSLSGGMSRPAGMGPGPRANGGRSVTEGKDKEGEKSASWMNVFAHLDPLVNEKV